MSHLYIEILKNFQIAHIFINIYPVCKNFNDFYPESIKIYKISQSVRDLLMKKSMYQVLLIFQAGIKNK